MGQAGRLGRVGITFVFLHGEVLVSLPLLPSSSPPHVFGRVARSRTSLSASLPTPSKTSKTLRLGEQETNGEETKRFAIISSDRYPVSE